jgi:hypothetical protein
MEFVVATALRKRRPLTDVVHHGHSLFTSIG